MSKHINNDAYLRSHIIKAIPKKAVILNDILKKVYGMESTPVGNALYFFQIDEWVYVVKTNYLKRPSEFLNPEVVGRFPKDVLVFYRKFNNKRYFKYLWMNKFVVHYNRSNGLCFLYHQDHGTHTGLVPDTVKAAGHVFDMPIENTEHKRDLMDLLNFDDNTFKLKPGLNFSSLTKNFTMNDPDNQEAFDTNLADVRDELPSRRQVIPKINVLTTIDLENGRKWPKVLILPIDHPLAVEQIKRRQGAMGTYA